MIVYRTLSTTQYQDFISGKDIQAKNPKANILMQTHIRKTLKNTQWISASKNFHQMFIRRKNSRSLGAIVRIDTDIAEKYGVKVFDLSTDELLEANGIRDRQTKNFAKGAQEVLLLGNIPQEACTLLINEGERDTEIDEELLKTLTKITEKPRKHLKTLKNKLNQFGLAKEHLSHREVKEIMTIVYALYSENLQISTKWYSINL